MVSESIFDSNRFSTKVGKNHFFQFKSSIPKIKTFVKGIQMDLKAVKNAILHLVSNGITEGYVNKFKLVKRIM